MASSSTLPQPQRRTALVALAALALTGCAGLLVPDRVVLRRDELASALDRRFPLQRQLLEVLDVRIARPQLTLRPELNRLAADVELSAVDRLFGQALRGRITFDTGLRYEATDASVRLAQVRVSELRLDDGAARHPAAQRLGAALAERVLEDFVVVRLKPEQQARLARAGVQPAAVNVTPEGVEIALAPAAR